MLLRLLASFILLASLLVLPKVQGAVGDTFTTGLLRYTVLTEKSASKTGTVSVRRASENISGDITIPSSVFNKGINYSVTSIEMGAFCDCSSLTSIIIPDSVTEIGTVAFGGCSSLTSVIIPDSVTEIGLGAFGGCSSLTKIVVGENNPRYSSLDGVLFNKYQTTLIQCPGRKSGTYIVPDGVTSIGMVAFLKCSNLTSVIIPDSVTEIGMGAFGGCSSLTSVIIPDSVTSIGGRAFYKCDKLTDVYFKGDAPKLPEGNAFFEPSVIYYKPGTKGWKNSWSGRPAKEWVE